jgi:hypothetical protein
MAQPDPEKDRMDGRVIWWSRTLLQIAGIMAGPLHWPLSVYRTASLLELSKALHDMAGRVDAALAERPMSEEDRADWVDR